MLNFTECGCEQSDKLFPHIFQIPALRYGAASALSEKESVIRGYHDLSLPYLWRLGHKGVVS